MKSLSFMRQEVDMALYYDIASAIKDLQYYFYKFNTVNSDEAISKTYVHVLEHYREEKLSGDIKPYIKKLARTILQKHDRSIPVDFIEDTLDDSADGSVGQMARAKASTSDFIEELVRQMYDEDCRDDLIYSFALLHLEEFVSFCKDALEGARGLSGYSAIFRKGLYTLAKDITDLTSTLISVYEANRYNFELFLSTSRAGVWVEADYNLITNSHSRRVQIITHNEDGICDPDYFPFSIKGKKYIDNGDKRIYKVPYYDYWEAMCDLIDSDFSNRMKCVLGKHYLVKTGGGSISVLDPDLNVMYDLLRDEILTNILRDTGFRFLGAGSENFYLLGDRDYKVHSRLVNGIAINFKLEDITDEVSIVR